MILLTRVDHRLLHGQVATSWVGTLGADCIFCVGDHVANDPVWKTTQIKSLNLGNTKESSTTKTIARQVFLEPEEEEILRELGARGVEVEIRGLAEEPKVDALKLI